MLGVYLSGHPLDEYRQLIENNITASTADLTSGGEEFTSGRDDGDSMVINTSKFSDGDFVILAGMLSGVRTMFTRKSQEMARITLEDFDGVIDAIAFPKVYEKKRNIIRNDQIVGMSGRVSFKDESEAEILIEDIVPVEDIRRLAQSRRGGYRDYGNGYQDRQNSDYRNGSQNGQAAMPQNGSSTGAGPASEPLNDPVKLRVSEEVLAKHCDAKGLLYHLTDMMSLYPGRRDVLVYLPGQKPVRCSKNSRIELTDDLRGRFIRLLGAENVNG
jgi:DNA polymerase-3 subunit alpha